MQLSVIIPVYNVSDYLNQCLTSVLNQDVDYSDYEAIIVNDGSTDGSLTIAKNFADKYENIIIVSQKNQGLSAARNMGLSLAKGDYVWFVDSDDYIEKNCLKEIICTLYKNNLDGLRLRHIRDVDGKRLYDQRKLSKGVISGQDCLKNHRTYREAAWLTIYKRSILDEHGLKFIEGKIHEDTEFTPKAYYYLERVMFLDKYVYCYRMNSKSLTSDDSLLEKRCLDLLDIACAMKEFCEKKVRLDFRPVYRQYIAFAINSAMEYAWRMDKSKRSVFRDKLNCSKSLFSSFVKSSDLRLKFEGALLMMIPSIRLEVYKMLNSLQRCLH